MMTTCRFQYHITNNHLLVVAALLCCLTPLIEGFLLPHSPPPPPHHHHHHIRHCLLKSSKRIDKPSLQKQLQLQKENNDKNDNDNHDGSYYYWQSHVSTHPESFNAFKQIWSDVTHKDQLGIAFLFVGQAHASDFEQLVQHAKLQLSGTKKKIRLISVLGGGVIGENIELDQMERPSMSLLIGGLPKGAEVEIVDYINTDQEQQEQQDNFQLDERFTSCLVFADPWAPVERMISATTSSSSVLAGGISCPSLADQSTLAVDRRCLPQGSMIKVGFAGTLGLQTMVAQGCRPVGKIFTVTACDGGNIITKLNDKPALQVLQDVANSAPPDEQEKIESGLLCGISSSSRSRSSSTISSTSSSSSSSSETTPDFLSRQIMGFVPSVQGIAISDLIQPGDLFCFQVRDGTTAQQDLQLMVQRAKTARLFDNVGMGGSSRGKGRPLAALQISCVARGRSMFDNVPNVDLSKVKQLVVASDDDSDNNNSSPAVVGGFFANGEIGPVGLAGFSTTFDGQSYLHSFTTVAAILCEYTASGSSSDSSNDGVVQESSLDAWG